MTSHIVCLTGLTDRYAPVIEPGDTILTVPFDVPDHPDAIQTSVPDVFATHGLTPTPSAEGIVNLSRFQAIVLHEVGNNAIECTTST